MRWIALACVAALAAGCSMRAPVPDPTVRQQKLNEITTLWVQIRDWRREAHMDLDPSPSTMLQLRRGTPQEACPPVENQPKLCDDVCGLADAICDNAERICTLANELGDDQLAQDKCTSAKASCREAKQRCCTCSAGDAPIPAAAPMTGAS